MAQLKIVYGSSGEPFQVWLDGKELAEVQEVIVEYTPGYSFNQWQYESPTYDMGKAALYKDLLYGGKVGEYASGGVFSTPLAPAPPDVELMDSSNPFAKALDAWQTNKAGWTKGALHKKAGKEQP